MDCRRCASALARASPRSSNGCSHAARRRHGRISLREMRKGRDGAEDLLRPPDEAGLTSDGGEHVLDRRVELARTHRLEETLTDLQRLEPAVFLVAQPPARDEEDRDLGVDPAEPFGE